MVKRLCCICFVLIIVICFSLPAAAVDVMESESDNFGFSYDNSNIYFFTNDLKGCNISVDNQQIPASTVYFYIPVSNPCRSLDIYLSIYKTGTTLSVNSYDYGSLSSGSYSITSALDAPTYSTLGRTQIEGSSAYVCSFKFGFNNLPFDSYASRRFIRLSFNLGSNDKLILWLAKDLDLSLTGTNDLDSGDISFTGTQSITPGTASYSGSVSTSEHNVSINSGNLITQEAYITGGYRSYYASTSYNTVILNSSTTSPNLRIPRLSIMCNSSNSLGGKISATTSSESGNISLGNMTGTFSGSNVQGSFSQSLSGDYTHREYINVVTLSATRSYDDADLIDRVDQGFNQNHSDLSDLIDRTDQGFDQNHSDLLNTYNKLEAFKNKNHDDITNASDRNHTDITNFSNRNHTDLVNIGNNLQKLVDHQDEVNQAGNDIGSTTSSSTISNTSGNLSGGVSGLNSTLSTASDVSSFVSASTPYISFIGAFLPVVLNFGNGVLAWAVVAIIAVTVFLYILKKVSE